MLCFTTNKLRKNTNPQQFHICFCLTIVWTGHHRLISFARRLWCQWKWMYWEWREQMQLQSLPLRPESYLASVPLCPESYLATSCQRLSLSLNLCHCTSPRWLLLKFEFPKTIFEDKIMNTKIKFLDFFVVNKNVFHSWKCFCATNSFLAVQTRVWDSSIPTPVTHSLTTRHFTFWH